jgi:hypothetical protein
MAMSRRQILIGGASLAVAGAGAVLIGAKRMGSPADYEQAAKAMRRPLRASAEVQELIRLRRREPGYRRRGARLWRRADL